MAEPTVGQGVGQRSPWTGNIIREVITLPSRGTSRGGAGGGSTRTTTKSYVDSSGVIRREGQTGFKEADYQRAVSSGQRGSSGIPQTPPKSYVDSSGVIRREGQTGFKAGDYTRAVSAGQVGASGIPKVPIPKTPEQPRFFDVRTQTFRPDEQRVFSQGTALRLQGASPVSKVPEVKVFKDSRGIVVGVQDPVTGKSFATNLPESYFKQRAIDATLEKDLRAGRIDPPKPRQTDVNPLKNNQKPPTRRLRDFVNTYSTATVSNFIRFDRAVTPAVREYLVSLGRGALKLGVADPAFRQVLSILNNSPVARNAQGRKLLNTLNSYTQLVPRERNLIKDKDVQNVALMTGLLFVPGAAQTYGAFNLGYSGSALAESLLKRDYKNAVLASASVALSALLLIGAGKKINIGSPAKGAKVGTIYKQKGQYKIITKGGRVANIPKKYNRVLDRASREGSGIRLERTATARAVKKQLAGKPLTSTERNLLRISTQKKTLTKLRADGRKIAQRLELKGANKNEFVRLYVKYQQKPTQANINAFKKFARKVDRQVGTIRKPAVKRPRRLTDVSKLDLRLSNAIFREKYGVSKSVVNKYMSSIRATARKLGATKADIQRLDRLTFKKATKAKDTIKEINKILNNLGKKTARKTALKGISRLDNQARRLGFRNHKQKLNYEIQIKRYNAGIKGADARLRAIQRDMLKFKKSITKKRISAHNKMVKSLVRQAKRKLETGQLAVKNKRFKVVKKAPVSRKMTKAEAERLLLQVNERLRVLERKKISKERMINRQNAKKALLEIEKGNVVKINPQVRGELKQLMNNEMYTKLKAKKLLEIGRTPKTALPKAQKASIKARAKQETRLKRIARKQEKRQFAGSAKERKIRRQQYVKQIEQEKEIARKILRGEIQGNFKVTIDNNLGIKITPLKPRMKKITFMKDLLNKKNIPKGAVQKINKDGTIQILKTEKIAKKLPKAELRQLAKKKSQAVATVRQDLVKQKQLLEQKIKALSKTKSRISISEASQRWGSLAPKVARNLLLVTSLSQTGRALEKRIDRILQSGTRTTASQTTTLRQAQTQASSIAPKLDQSVRSLSDSRIKNSLTSAQVSEVASASKLVQKLKQKSKLKKKPIKKVVKKKKPLPVPAIKLLTWDSRPPKGKQFMVNVLVRIKGKNREIPIRTTPNRAIKFIATKVDNTTARSFDLKIVGLTSKKDIKKPSLRKFRTTKTKNSPVLRFVEKTKYVIDTPGEKRGLNLARALKESKKTRRKANVKKSKNTAVRKTRSKKRTKRAPSKPRRANTKRSKSSRNTKRS